MIRKVLIISAFLLSAVCIYAAQSDDASLIRQCAAKIKSAPSLNVSYTVTADGNTAGGVLVLQGDMFTISSPGMVSWYDGKTQWTYSSQIGEVNIITPTPEELQQINPLAIVKSFSSGYTTQLLKSPAGKSIVRLTSKNAKSDITSADITIDNTTLYPTRIVLTMSNRQKVTIDIKSVNRGGKLPTENFRFDKKRYPGVQVVDLR